MCHGEARERQNIRTEDKIPTIQNEQTDHYKNKTLTETQKLVPRENPSVETHIIPSVAEGTLQVNIESKNKAK